jgi:ribonuclease BN (tRNA processing enzyme)
VAEAVASGSQMHARHVVLTHFSQRYPKAVAAEGHVAMAWDFLRFQRQHLEQLPLLSSLARKVFPEQQQE